jgi:hypothetical protein
LANEFKEYSPFNSAKIKNIKVGKMMFDEKMLEEMSLGHNLVLNLLLIGNNIIKLNPNKISSLNRYVLVFFLHFGYLFQRIFNILTYSK